jgi:dynein heavy chain, axonemal
MDDNKLLTLANGERIRLQDHSRLLFEVIDLKYASPATVSRCGMVYVDAANLDHRSIWQRWLNVNFVDVQSNEKEQLNDFYDRYVDRLLDLIYHGRRIHREQRTQMKMIVPLYVNQRSYFHLTRSTMKSEENFLSRTKINLIHQLTRLLDCTYLPLLSNENKESDRLTSNVRHACFLQALIWSFGACLHVDDRHQFDSSIQYLSNVSIGSNDCLFDYVFQPEFDRWMSWQELLPDYQHDQTKRFIDRFVPTIETIRIEWLMKFMLNIHQPVLFIGDTGSSKTATIHSYLEKIETNSSHLTVNFSSRTTSVDVQRSIECHLDKRTKDTYGPAKGARLIIFLDNLSMPTFDTYRTQQPIAFVKLLIEKHGMFERTGDLSWKTIDHIDLIAAMNTPGRNIRDRYSI